MRLFYSRKYEKEYQNGTVPSTENLTGEWAVKMLTGPIPNLSFWPFRHRKQFTNTGFRTWGVNLMFRDWHWGWFDVLCFVLGNSRMAYFNYTVPENGFLTYRIRDSVRQSPNPDYLIGKFYMTLWNKPRFLGYFRLVKINP